MMYAGRRGIGDNILAVKVSGLMKFGNEVQRRNSRFGIEGKGFPSLSNYHPKRSLVMELAAHHFSSIIH